MRLSLENKSGACCFLYPEWSDMPLKCFTVPVHLCVVHTELADVVIAGGLWHGSDGEQGTAVSSQCLTQLILSIVDLSCT